MATKRKKKSRSMKKPPKAAPKAKGGPGSCDLDPMDPRYRTADKKEG